MSIQVLCISPLKALINDQHRRLVVLCRDLGIEAHKWHGDVNQEAKARVRDRPSGILLITPESLESCLTNYSHRVADMFGQLRYVVIDELHALLESERGMHIRSLLARVEAIIDRRPRYFALSATLGDPLAARGFLNQSNPDAVRLITDTSTRRPIDVQVVTVVTGQSERQGERNHLAMIADDIREFSREGSYLVFANNRRTVEELADVLRVPVGPADTDEPLVVLHHGSLSQGVRHRTESLLKSGSPARALCTSSLELGIDIGTVEGVAQIDPTWSVSSLAQRLGRSGRKPGATSRLRLYVRTNPPSREASLVDLLHPRLLQATAMVNLLIRSWLEPNATDRAHWSTLVHQILSVLRQTGGQQPLALYRSLCQTGPFRRVEPAEFRQLLSALVFQALINQDSDGTVFLGLEGERITSAPSFYAAFTSPVELTVRHKARVLGRLPVTNGLKEGECLLLAGRRWEIARIAWKSRTIWVSPSPARKAPLFLGGVGDIHDEVFAEMRRVLVGTDEPDWLDAQGCELLAAARETAIEVGLDHYDLVEFEDGVQWFPWAGTRTMLTLQLLARMADIRCRKDALSLSLSGTGLRQATQFIHKVAHEDINPTEVAAQITNKHVERFDRYVPEALLDRANATDRLNLSGARVVAERAILKIDSVRQSPTPTEEVPV